MDDLLVAVHPFTDGDGRTARLVMNWRMRRHGVPRRTIESEGSGEQLDELEAANAGRCVPFTRFVCERVLRSIGRLVGDHSGE